jgi:hypothetical protein
MFSLQIKTLSHQTKLEKLRRIVLTRTSLKKRRRETKKKRMIERILKKRRETKKEIEEKRISMLSKWAKAAN